MIETSIGLSKMCMPARCVLVALITMIAMGAEASANCQTTAGRIATVTAVIDTLTLRLEDGSTARLTGVIPPPVPGWWKHEKPWPLAEAALQSVRKLVEGGKVELRRAENEHEKDRHGRLLAQVYLLRGQEKIWVQAHLLDQGLALANSFSQHRLCARALQEREAAARRAGRGLWRSKSFAVLDAADVRSISKRRGRFQIVEGRVQSVGVTGKWTFINFSRDWKRDFTVAIRARDRRAFKQSDVPLDRLEGRRVRVRGWIERWNGPVIKASHPEQIELLETGDASSEPDGRR